MIQYLRNCSSNSLFLSILNSKTGLLIYFYYFWSIYFGLRSFVLLGFILRVPGQVWIPILLLFLNFDHLLGLAYMLDLPESDLFDGNIGSLLIFVMMLGSVKCSTISKINGLGAHRQNHN